jgi:hypothetical protein
MWKIDKGSLTGTTGPAYAGALDWKTEELREKTIVLKNTHGANSLKYKLVVYACAGGIAGEEIGESSLAAGETAKMLLLHQWDRVVLQVINGSGQATYQADYIGQGA